MIRRGSEVLKRFSTNTREFVRPSQTTIRLTQYGVPIGFDPHFSRTTIEYMPHAYFGRSFSFVLEIHYAHGIKCSCCIVHDE